MHRLLSFCLLAIAGIATARGQQAVQEFSGSGSTTTRFFTVGDRWEVRWNAREAVSVAALSANGTLVAGASGVLRGSLFIPAGGQYYLKITDGTAGAPAPATNAPPPAPNEVPSEIVPDSAPAVTSAVFWHVRVVQLAPTVSSTETLTVYTPYFAVPDAAITASTPPPPPSPILTPDQVKSLVTIKGDNAQGSGFLLRKDGKAYIVAHLRLLAANPNPQITTSAGAALKILSMSAASDRNLVLINVQDDHLTCLTEANTDPALTDYVIIPEIGQENAIAAKVGRIINIEQDRIDFDAQLDLTSNSAPVIAVDSGKVLGIVTAEKQVDLNDATAKAWPENPAPGAAGISPYFGLSVRGVSRWERLDLAAFERETDFLKSFHNTTRCLDGYLNGPLLGPETPPSASTGPPDCRDYAGDSRIAAAVQNYHRRATDADTDQALDSARELLDDLQSIAANDVDRMRGMGFAYAINRRRAEEEMAYRKSLTAQLSALGNDIARFNTSAQMPGR